MIIMPVKEGENIERALKKFKRKYERTGVLKELRRRQYFTKPSIAKREAMQHASVPRRRIISARYETRTGNTPKGMFPVFLCRNQPDQRRNNSSRYFGSGQI